jgi:C-terminal processing protease CtpA/Prc
MMHHELLHIRVLATLMACVMAPAAAAPAPKGVPQPLPLASIERLTGLAKLWGAVKYFHPYLADRNIDWDEALVKAIPRVEAARSPEEYRAAIDYLLSFLNDPNTHTVERPAPEAASTPAKPQTSGAVPQPHVHFTDDNIAIVDATDYAQVMGKMKDFAAFEKPFEEATKGKAIVLDLRGQMSSHEEIGEYWYSRSFRQAIPLLVDRDIPLSSTRHRMYSGYPTQSEGYTGYYGAFTIQDGARIAAKRARGSGRPLVILIDSKTGPVHDIVAGLKSAGLARVVQEGDGGEEPGLEGYRMDLPDGVAVTMRTSEFVNPDGSIGFHPDETVRLSLEFEGAKNQALRTALRIARGEDAPPKRVENSGAQPTSERRENGYADMPFPSKEYRLLALFRFWNVIHFFYPYQALFDRPWDETLTEFIPQFEADSNVLDYSLTVARMVSRIQDTHGFIRSSVFTDYIGASYPAISVQSIEGQTVITHVSDESAVMNAGIQIGDVILAVDGEEIGARRARLGQLFAASTPQALRWRVDRTVLAGSKDSTARLRVQKADGRTIESMLPRNAAPQRFYRPTPVYGVLPLGFGYMDLVRLMPDQVDAAFEAIEKTTAVIIDIRGYPNGVFELLGSRLTEKKVIGARFETPTPQSPDPTEESRVKFVQYVEPSAKWKYKGRVVVLINEDAISQSEHTCLMLEATAHATFIGMPTNGANGDVTLTVLPGNIGVSFSGHDVRHADGRQLQRLGIQPDIKVSPTIAGIRAGRDEVLERAIEYLRGNASK